MVLEVAPNIAEADIAFRFEVFAGKFRRLIRVIQLLRPFAGRPEWTEFGDNTANLVAGNAVASFVRAATRGVLDPASRDYFGYDVRQLADAIVF